MCFCKDKRQLVVVALGNSEAASRKSVSEGRYNSQACFFAFVMEKHCSVLCSSVLRDTKCSWLQLQWKQLRCIME